MVQKAFLQKIAERLSDEISLNEAIARVLDISYDAAYRRTSLRCKFSLNESLILANHFNISLDSLHKEANNRKVLVEKTEPVIDEYGVQRCLERTCGILEDLPQKKGIEIYYSAKDIPIFYMFNNDLLSRFKIYVWLKILDKNFRRVNFKDFYPKLLTSQSAKRLATIYQDLSITEIWDITTVNSILKQIYFYYEAGQIAKKTALDLCGLVHEIIENVLIKVISKNDMFKLYYNELLLMDNTILVKTTQEKRLYAPFTMLSFYQTSEEETCNYFERYLKKHIDNSKLLNVSGEKDQNVFYNKMKLKINTLQELITKEERFKFE